MFARLASFDETAAVDVDDDRRLEHCRRGELSQDRMTAR